MRTYVACASMLAGLLLNGAVGIPALARHDAPTDARICVAAALPAAAAPCAPSPVGTDREECHARLAAVQYGPPVGSLRAIPAGEPADALARWRIGHATTSSIP